MTMNDALIALIDQRIAQALTQPVRMGTVSERQPNNRAMVILDGSSQAVPVKVFANVAVADGDRVGLVKFGSEWVVTGSFTTHVMKAVSRSDDIMSPANTNSGSFVTMGLGTFPFVKQFDGSGVFAGFNIGVFPAGPSASQAAFGLQMVGATTGFSQIFHLVRPFLNTGLIHENAGCSRILDGSTAMLADTYTCDIMWAVSVGSIPIHVDANDDYSITLIEVTV